MEFTDNEVKSIIAARKKIIFSTILRVLIIAAMLIGIFLMAKGWVAAEHISYLFVVAVILSVAHPQLSWGPKYEDLVKILERKANIKNENP